MDEETNYIAKIFIAAAIIGGLIILFSSSIEPASKKLFSLSVESLLKKEEKRECFALQKQASLEGFFLTSWEKRQCDAVGVKINAPVKGGG